MSNHYIEDRIPALSTTEGVVYLTNYQNNVTSELG
jgi:hypothetical protein